jgi:hypothetical protein
MLDLNLLAKALDTTSASTGNTLIPQVINPYIIELARKLSPLRAQIPRKDWKNLTFTYKQRLATMAGQSYGENDTWTLNNNAYASQVQTMKILGELGGVSNLLQEGSQEFVDAFMLEIDGAVRGCAKYEEFLLLNGSSASNPKQFDGVAAQLVTNVQQNSGTISFNLLDAMDDAVKTAGFGVDPASCVWVTTPNMSTAIARLTQPYFRQDGNSMNLMGGFAATMYRNKRILESSAAASVVSTATESLSGSGTTYAFANKFVITQPYDDQLGNLNSGGALAPAPVIKVSGSTVPASAYTITTDPFGGVGTIVFNTAPAATPVATYYSLQQNIYLLDFSTMVVPVLHDLGFENLPDPINVDQKVFRVKAYECLAVMAEKGNAVAFNVHG